MTPYRTEKRRLDLSRGTRQQKIVREIKRANGPDFDTTVYSDNRAEYTVTVNTNGTGSPLDRIVTIQDDTAARGMEPTRSSASDACSSPARQLFPEA